MKKKSFILGALIGTVTGAVATALTTPKDGKTLRKDITKEADKLYNEAKIKYSNLSEATKEKYNLEKKKIIEKYNEGTETYREEIQKLNKKYFSKKSEKEEQEEQEKLK